MSYVSPGAYFREIDFSLYVPNLSSTIVGMVGTATKGPVNVATLITNVPAFISTFGNPSTSHYMPYAALEYLRRGKLLIVVRVAGAGALAADAVFNAFVPAFVESSDADQSFTLDSSSNNLRILYTDSRPDPDISKDVTITLDAGTYGTAALMAAHIAAKLQRNSQLSDCVTCVVKDSKVALIAYEPATQVGIQVQAATSNSAHTALGFGTTAATGTAAGSLSLKCASVGSYGNYISVQIIPKTNFLHDVVVYEGTPLNTSGYRTEFFQNVSLDDSTTSWVGSILGTDAQPAKSGAIHLDTGDTIATAAKFTLLERKTTPLTGGDDDEASVISADFIGITSPAHTGLQIFRENEAVDVNVICVPGISAPAVINEMIAICEERADCMAIVDPPDNYTPQQVIDWHNGAGSFNDHAAFDSSYAALYWPWVKIYDSYNGVDVWTPPSGHVAAVYAYTDFIAETWFAPAGFNRAHLLAAQDVRYNPDHGEREALYGNQNAVNPIVKFPKEGITIWGQRTLQRAPTARDRVNVRRLLLYLRKVIATAVKYLIFEPNDPATWRQFVRLIHPFMESVQSRRGVYAYQIVCDETTNTPDLIDNNTMAGRIYLQPTKAAEIINVDFILTPTGAKFSDYAELLY